jgi:hypothetical protein
LIRTGVVALVAMPLLGCAARGHVATPAEMAALNGAPGLSSSGKITLEGPRGKFSARVVFGVSRPDSLRIEIPAGAGLRFLLVAKNGRLRADLPVDEAMFEGPATSEVMKGLFGIDLSPRDLVSAILGSPPQSLDVSWRFENSRPVRMAIQGANNTRLTLSLDEPETETPPSEAFNFGAARRLTWTLHEMSERLGLTR